MNIKNILFFFAIILFFSCDKEETQTKYQVNKFKNLIDISGIASSEYKLDPFGFSDLGAWHAYALIDKDSSKYYGGFTGPLCMKMHGRWLSKSISKLVIVDVNTNKEINLSKAKFLQTYYPGRLEQTLKTKDINVSLNLIYVSNRTALISTSIKNKTKDKKTFKIAWRGTLLNSTAKIVKSKNGVRILLNNKGNVFSIETKRKNKSIVSNNQQSYTIILDSNIEINAEDSAKLNMLHSYYFNQEEENLEKSFKINIIGNSKFAFEQNLKRWNKYINKALADKKHQNSHEQKLIVKCIETLHSNWRSAAGDLKHDGIFPSTAYQGFYGFWSWDSWKHAVALARFNPLLAKSSILSMFDFQNKRGMIADCVYYNSDENNWRDTKAPLASWAVWNYYKQTKDIEFVKQMMPKLVKYHYWWYTYRDNNKNSLCEYGSTDGSLVAAKWESGMDNAIRFDKAVMLKNNKYGWSMDQESVDLNSYLYAEKIYIAKLAKLINKKTLEQKLIKEAKHLKGLISDRFYNSEYKYFFDYSLSTNKHITTYGPEGWIPLWANLANKEQAEGVRNIIMHSRKFDTRLPFPTISADDNKFNPLDGYWRGPVWLDQAYFGVVALKNYDYNTEAKSLKTKLLNNAEGVLKDKPLRENYHPITGKGLNAKHFSWSAAHYFLLCTDK